MSRERDSSKFRHLGRCPSKKRGRYDYSANVLTVFKDSCMITFKISLIHFSNRLKERKGE